MKTLSKTDVEKLKNIGFKSCDISHLKAGRFGKVSKDKIKIYHKIFEQKKKRSYNKAIVINENGIKLKPFVKLKVWSNNEQSKTKAKSKQT